MKFRRVPFKEVVSFADFYDNVVGFTVFSECRLVTVQSQRQ